MGRINTPIRKRSFINVHNPPSPTNAPNPPRLSIGLTSRSNSGSTASGGCASTLTSTSIHQLLQTKTLQSHLHETLIPTYAHRYHTLLSAIEKHLLPLGIKLPQTNREIVGGYFIWLSLPDGLDADEVVKRCKEREELIVSAGSAFEVVGDEEGGRFKGFLRVCWAWEGEGEVEEGVRRLGRVVGGMVGGGKAN